MDEDPRPAAPPAYPTHRAPPEGWRPVSGLAIAAFVTSIVLAIAALLGLWWVMLLPLLLGIFAFRAARPEVRRGRGFAIAAVVISVFLGVATYQGHAGLCENLGEMGSEVLGAMREGKAETLDRWIAYEATKTGAAKRIQDRYTQVSAEYGAYVGPVEAGNLWTGSMTVIVPPAGVVEVPASTDALPSAEKGATWVRVPFEKGTLHVALVFEGAGVSGIQRLARYIEARAPVPILADVRFFKGP